MKSLYSILGLNPDASSAQIETVYAELLAQLKDNPNALREEDLRIQHTAIKEAYSVLSDPTKRQLYNQKLFAPETLTRKTVSRDMDDSGGSESSGIKKILLIGVFAIGGGALYFNHAREMENLRLKHEHEVQMKAVQVMENAQQQSAAESESRIERLKQLDANAQERQQKADIDKFNREAEMRRQQNAREEEMNARREANEKRQAARDEEIKRRRETEEAQRRVQRDKAELQSIERSRYGRVITH